MGQRRIQFFSFKEINGINKGLERLANHLVRRISHDDLKVAFAKVAYIGRLIRDPGVSRIIKNVDLSVIDGIQLEGKYKILDGLKKRSVPAYFYWVLAAGVKA